MTKKLAKIFVICGFALLFANASASADNQGRGIAAFKKGDYQSALHLLATEADNGSTDALFALGLMHEYGLGVEKSPSQAASYYFKGAQINARNKRLVQARIFAIAIERTSE